MLPERKKESRNKKRKGPCPKLDYPDENIRIIERGSRVCDYNTFDCIQLYTASFPRFSFPFKHNTSYVI